MTIVLDTDHLTLLDWGRDGSAALRERLAEVAPHDVTTTIVNYEEQVRGWMAFIATTKSIHRQVEAYARLHRQLKNYQHIPILDFDNAAADEYQRLRKARVRVGTMDLKIAAIVLSQDALLVSRNLADFDKVPGLKVEDWSE